MTTATSTSPQRSKRSAGPIVILLLLVLAVLLLWNFGVFASRPKVALVTSGDGPYWDPVIAGANQAAAQYDVELTIVRPKTDVTVQTQAVRELMAGRKFDGVAVSPINPVPQAVMLADIAGVTTLVTFDSDSPVARRLCFVGTDNYAAGRHLAEYVKQAVPDGGEVVIVMGTTDKENTQRRRQGIIDELLDRSFEPTRPTEDFESSFKGERYIVSATLVDGADPGKATELVAEAMKKDPNIKCFVGLLSYSTPAILKGLDQAGKLGKVQVAGFDMHPETLAGIEAGNVLATVMQDQYGLGYHTVRILAENARGFKMGLPTFQVRSLPIEIVTKVNLAAIRDQMGRPATQPTARS